MNRILFGLFCIAWAVLPARAQDMDTLGHGLPWIFFNATDFTRPDNDTGIDARINHDTGESFNDYAQFWTGYLKAPVSGAITLEAEADNGLRLTLNKQLVIDGWATDGAREGKLTAQKGQYLPLQLEFFQDGGTAILRLYWRWEGRERELIPASAFFHDQQDKDLIERLRTGEVRVPEVRTVKP